MKLEYSPCKATPLEIACSSTPGSILGAKSVFTTTAPEKIFLTGQEEEHVSCLQMFFIMKTLMYVMLTLGVALSGFVVLNMFFFWTMNDGIWFMAMLMSMLFISFGFWIEAYLDEPLSRSQVRQRRKRMEGLIVVMVLLVFCAGYVAFYYSKIHSAV